MKILPSLVVLLCCFCYVTILNAQQIADSNFQYAIHKPMYAAGKGPVIVLDEAHYNFHTLSGRYYAFGKLLQADGYKLKEGQSTFTPDDLADIDILVIANALPDDSDWVLPTKPAFTKEEVSAVHDWVSNGGSLFLIADHMPFPGAAAELAKAFGFNFINGYAMRDDDGEEVFSRKKGNLMSNDITNGRNTFEKIDSMKTFTGQGFIAPLNATIISSLKDDYTLHLTTQAGVINDSTMTISGLGCVNGAYLEYGKGRLVVFGEAAMFSAQLAGEQKNKIGMNDPHANQNPQLLLNIIHWLDKKID